MLIKCYLDVVEQTYLDVKTHQRGDFSILERLTEATVSSDSEHY